VGGAHRASRVSRPNNIRRARTTNFKRWATKSSGTKNEIRKIEDEELDLMVQADKIKADLAEEETKAAAVKESITRQTADLMKNRKL
jgi:hypothetical protein